MTGEELLHRLAPPLSIIEKIESAAMYSKLPDDVEAWRQLWIDIRGDGKSAIDGAGTQAYQQALIVVEEKTKRKAKAY